MGGGRNNLPSRPTHECITGIVFPRWCGIYNEMILKVANAERCGRINACRQAARRVLLSMRHGVALSSRTGIDLSAWLRDLVCCWCVSVALQHLCRPPLPWRAPPPVELCSHSAAVEGSGNHSAGCTLFAQTPVIAPLSRVGLLWVMAECVMLESTTFSCRTQKVLIFSLFLQEMVFIQSFIQSHWQLQITHNITAVPILNKFLKDLDHVAMVIVTLVHWIHCISHYLPAVTDFVNVGISMRLFFSQGSR